MPTEVDSTYNPDLTTETESPDDPFYRKAPTWLVTMSSISVVFMWFLGVLGNAIVVDIYRRKPIKTASSLFITALGIVDCVICMFCMPVLPFALSRMISLVVQEVWEEVLVFSVVLSIGLLVSIAMDRNQAICNPLARKISYAKSKVMVLCLLACSTLLTLGNMTFVLFPDYGIYYVYVLGVYLLGSLLLLFMLYARIFWTLISRRKVGITTDQPKPSASTSTMSTANTGYSTGQTSKLQSSCVIENRLVSSGKINTTHVQAKQTVVSNNNQQNVQHSAKTAKMLAVVTLVFLFSYVSPYIVSYFIIPGTPIHWIFSSYINNIANPVILS